MLVGNACELAKWGQWQTLEVTKQRTERRDGSWDWSARAWAQIRMRACLGMHGWRWYSKHTLQELSSVHKLHTSFVAWLAVLPALFLDVLSPLTYQMLWHAHQRRLRYRCVKFSSWSRRIAHYANDWGKKICTPTSKFEPLALVFLWQRHGRFSEVTYANINTDVQ